MLGRRSKDGSYTLVLSAGYVGWISEGQLRGARAF